MLIVIWSDTFLVIAYEKNICNDFGQNFDLLATNKYYN